MRSSSVINFQGLLDVLVFLTRQCPCLIIHDSTLPLLLKLVGQVFNLDIVGQSTLSHYDDKNQESKLIIKLLISLFNNKTFNTMLAMA